MSTIRVVNIQHPDSVEPNVVLKTDGTAVFASGITISGSTNLTVSGTAEFASGTAANPGITFIDDNDTGIYSPAANEVAITTNGTERLRVDNTGQVGIGTSNPNSVLHLSASSPELIIDKATAVNATGGTEEVAKITAKGQKNGVAGPCGSIIFRQDGTTWSSVNQYHKATRIELCTQDASSTDRSETPRLVVDQDGKVGIGTTSPGTNLHISSASVGFNPAEDANELFLSNTDNCGLTIGCGPNKTGNIFFGEQGVGVSRGAIVYNTNGDSMVFSIAGLTNERMRIDSSGNIFTAGTDSISAIEAGTQAGKVFKSNHAASSGSTGTGTSFHFSFANPNGFVGSISTNGSATAFNTSSDYRLKENVVDLEGAINRVKQLAPKRFNFIADADITVDGFLAHEAQAIVPEAVTGTHNEVDDEGNPVMQGIDQAKLVPLLTAALQEAVEKIETLEQRLTDAGL